MTATRPYPKRSPRDAQLNVRATAQTREQLFALAKLHGTRPCVVLAEIVAREVQRARGETHHAKR